MSPLFESRLPALGWDAWFAERFGPFAAEGLVPARVTADFGAEYVVHDAMESVRAVFSRTARAGGAEAPAVGDWVALRQRQPTSVVEGIVERRTAFSRKVAGSETKEQVMAANVDVAFVVASAQDLNARRIERYLAMAWQSGAVPVVVVTKADLATSVEDLRAELADAVMGTPVLVTSGVTGAGVDAISDQLRPARTGVLLGPSGVGKSTLINWITGRDSMKTRAVFRTGEGRHTTSHRQLIELPGGGMIVDTPGLREAQLWEGEHGLASLFDDIERLVLQCRFPDCEHRTEPGCAVKGAIDDGSLDQARLDSYRKLQREVRAVAARSDARLRADERRKWKQIAVANKARERYLKR